VITRPADLLLDKRDLKYRVFRDICSLDRGYVTSGMKFGGDFLYYPGDPLVYHASAIFHLSSHVDFQPNELHALGRLGTSVKKRQIIAHEQHGRIVYHLVELGGETLWHLVLIRHLSLVV
jgi:tRNA-splicing endonuclease subunit Sen34